MRTTDQRIYQLKCLSRIKILEEQRRRRQRQSALPSFISRSESVVRYESVILSRPGSRGESACHSELIRVVLCESIRAGLSESIQINGSESIRPSRTAQDNIAPCLSRYRSESIRVNSSSPVSPSRSSLSISLVTSESCSGHI